MTEIPDHCTTSAKLERLALELDLSLTVLIARPEESEMKICPSRSSVAFSQMRSKRPTRITQGRNSTVRPLATAMPKTTSNYQGLSRGIVEEQ
jgi:hypothetical protein